ncbi:MAG: BatA domain-containing protein [Rubripirellula sp.]
MTFLNATLLFGLAATAIPVVLHLIARQEPRKVIFPSVQFLTKRFESNRSRVRVRRWWLLALRILAVGLLAIALARPAIHQSLSITWLTIGLIAAVGTALLVMASVALSKGESRGTAYGLGGAAAVALLAALTWGAYAYASGPTLAVDSIEPVAIAIVLDNSPTSAWKTADDDRIVRMKDVATWMVTRLPRTSRIAVLDRSAQVASFSLDTSNAVAKIEQLRPLEVTQSIASRLDAAARLVRTSDLPNRQILLVTDLSDATWSDALNDSGLAALLSESPSISLTLFDTGDFDGSNRSLSIPRFADDTPPRGTPISVSTTLAFASPVAGESDSVTAELQMYAEDPSLPVIRDGIVNRPRLRSVDRTSVRVAAGGSSELLLTIPSLDIGSHHGQIRLVGDDGMALDDVRYFTLEVLAPSSVLLVCDDPDEARVITQTMLASPGLTDEEDAEFQVERITFADLSVVRLADFDSVLLLNPPGAVLRDDLLTEYLEEGGGVYVSLGPNVNEESLDSGFVPALVRRWRSPAPGTFLQIVAANHPVTQAVAANTPWSDFRVQQYWQLKPLPEDSVLARYAGTDHAALTSRLVPSESGGPAGRVLVLSTPIPALSAGTRGWNDLFGTDPWPAWLLTRESVEYLTRRGSGDAMFLAGSPKVIPIPETEASVEKDSPAGDRSLRIQVFPPGDASPVPINVPDNAKQVTVTDTSRAGTYWLRGLQAGAGFSANLSPDAISLSRIDSGQLDQIFGPGGYSLATDRDGIEFAENQATQRVSLHSPAILLALAIFLLEQVLSNRFYRARSPAPA